MRTNRLDAPAPGNRSILIRPAAAGAALLLVLGANPLAWSQTLPARAIFTCVSASGKKLTSDRLIAECVGREQRVLNPDGSLNRIVPPSLTADERAKADARERALAAERNAKLEAARLDRSLLTRYPDEAAHRKAREVALESVRKMMHAGESRLAALANERKSLNAEAEFYVGKPLPTKLKAQIDANDVSTEGQRSQIESQKLEIARIDKAYDAELERLKKLWAGAPPGSVELQAAASAPGK